jgi:spermidine synthase
MEVSSKKFSPRKTMAVPNLEILAYEPSPLGILCLRRRELLSQPGTVVTEVTLNHEFLMSSLYTDSERVLASTAVEFHGGQDLHVLVGGLGLGYTAFEALRATEVRSVEVVELLPQVIDWLRQGLIPLSAELKDNSRLQLTAGDVYDKLASLPASSPPNTNSPNTNSPNTNSPNTNSPNTMYDVIMIDVDHSPDERLADDSEPFYSVPGLQAARQHLAPGGVLAIWSYAESSPFAESLRQVFDDVRVEPVTYVNELIHEERTDWLFFAR